MADFVIHVGSRTAQGKRSNNEDAFVVDSDRHVFLVADGMGGQENGEVASNLAVQIIPKAIADRLSAQEMPAQAVMQALQEAHRAIIQIGLKQSSSRRPGTTAVLAAQHQDQVWIAGIGDSPAFLIRNGKVSQLTIDHTVADALARNGTITKEQAKTSPWRNVLYRFLGCAEVIDDIEIKPFAPQPGDRLVLGSDGLSGFVTDEDLHEGGKHFNDPQAWADYLVELALERGSKDNVTCIVLAFEPVAPRSDEA